MRMVFSLMKEAIPCAHSPLTEVLAALVTTDPAAQVALVTTDPVVQVVVPVATTVQVEVEVVGMVQTSRRLWPQPMLRHPRRHTTRGLGMVVVVVVPLLHRLPTVVVLRKTLPRAAVSLSSLPPPPHLLPVSDLVAAAVAVVVVWALWAVAARATRRTRLFLGPRTTRTSAQRSLCRLTLPLCSLRQGRPLPRPLLARTHHLHRSHTNRHREQARRQCGRVRCRRVHN